MGGEGYWTCDRIKFLYLVILETRKKNKAGKSRERF